MEELNSFEKRCTICGIVKDLFPHFLLKIKNKRIGKSCSTCREKITILSKDREIRKQNERRIKLLKRIEQERVLLR